MSWLDCAGFLGCRKIGHTGTLDPFATGVLPIALGEEPRQFSFWMKRAKEYQAVMRLGVGNRYPDLTGRTVRKKTGA